MKQTSKNNFLEKVLEIKKEEIKHKKYLKRTSNTSRKKPGLFYSSIQERTERGKIFIIAEIKTASPTDRNLGNVRDIIKRVKRYEQSDADAISYITDKTFFGGDIKYIAKIKKAVKLPVLQKDFVIDESQIIESSNNGADALLLIAKILDTERLIRFVDLCRKYGVEPVVEINDLEDLQKAKATNTRIIAVNSRNLEDLTINIESAQKLLRSIPEKYIKLAFSGINSQKEVVCYKDSGADGVLVGTSLMKTENIERFLLSLRFRNETKVKICGIRTMSEAIDAINSGADILGFNFVKTSKRYITPADADKIIKKVGRNIKTAAIFQNQSAVEINKITDKLRPDFVQLHGEETKEFVKLLNKNQIIKSINDSDKILDFGCEYLLLDRIKQGSGKMFDLEKAKKIAGKYNVFFAGGLTPENVSEIVKKIKPYAVDIAGGVETNGIKTKQKLKKFIMNAKGVDL